MQRIQILFERMKAWQIALAIFLFGFVLYANTLNNQLFWDDYDSIVNNQYIRNWNYFPQYFSENLTAGSGIQDNYWRPMLLVSFSLDYHIAKLSPFIYHLQNFLWHFLSALLVYLIILKLFKNKLAAFFSALIFIVHPLQTEAVAYVAGRADPMHSAFLLFSFWFFLKYILGKASSKYLFFSLLLFSLALLTKERAIVFPALLVLYFITISPEKILDDWKNKLRIILPFFVLALIYFVLRLTLLHFTDTFDLGQPNNIGAANFGEKLLSYFKGLSVYFGLLFWPAKLYMEKTIALPKSFFDFSVIFGFILTLSSVIIIFFSLKKNKIMAFGLLWFWITFFPSFYIYPIQGLLYEHWLYFPLIGLLICFLIPLFDYFQKSSKIVKLSILSLLTIFILGLGTRTIIRNNDWQNPIAFYEKNVSLGGYSSRVYTNLGMAYSEAGKNSEAINTYQKAIRIDADIFQPWYDMGNSLTALGKTEEAVSVYQKAIDINPFFVPAYNNLAKILTEQKKLDKAIEFLQKGEEKNPDNIHLLYNLGIVYRQQGNKIQAKKYFQKALALDPTNADLIKIVHNL